MSLLVISLAPRPHLGARSGTSGESAAPLRAPAEFDYVLSRDGVLATRHGRCAPALMPKADTVVAVAPAADLAWHRVHLPKAPQARLRAALAGMLEEALLEDTEDTHLAVAPGASAGVDAWIVAMHRAWLVLQLGALEAVGIVVDRVVPQAEPGEPARGHFQLDDPDDDQALSLVWARPDGVLVLRPSGTLMRHWLAAPGADQAPTLWSAEPAAVAAAEQGLGQPVEVLSRTDAALQAAQSAWNLRQFDLANRPRGVRALRKGWRSLSGPAWRPLRVGLAMLVLVQLVGLNAWAWKQRHDLRAARAEQAALLQATFPQVRAVLDAPVQMQRETEQLRAVAGRPGDTDLEPMLQAVAGVWPQGRPLEGLRFEPGQLTLSVGGWPDEDIAELSQQLEPEGWRIERNGPQIILRRAPGGRS
jgi:general secretion pathway protein L